MSVGVLEEADGNVGGVDVLYEMLISFVAFHDEDEHQRGEMIPSVQINNQSFVGTFEIEYPMDRFLGGNVVSFPEERQRNCFFKRERQLSTR
jgi:hypothetical protein